MPLHRHSVILACLEVIVLPLRLHARYAQPGNSGMTVELILATIAYLVLFLQLKDQLFVRIA